MPSSDLDTFKQLCSQHPSKDDYPQSVSIQSRIPIYDATSFDLADKPTIIALKAELQRLLHHGPGVYVLKNMYPSRNILVDANYIFTGIINRERSSAKGDHFAAAGNNDRIWNSFGKHCLGGAGSFVEYYSNPWLRLVSESWLGPGYRITAQCNVVKPGGKPQQPHRDYHLGFQTGDAVAAFPLATQVASQFLTLQGAVAHSDMPLNSGPTRFLPYSQLYEQGYAAYRDLEFQQYFEQNWVSLPLEMGDGVFFNPALFHAAGENQSTYIQRSANLLQVSSAFGKPMESVDTVILIKRCWQHLKIIYQREGMSMRVESLVAAVAEGYPFPTNLDRRPPAPGGMAPEDEQAVLRRMLKSDASTAEVVDAIKQLHEESKM